MSSQHKQVEKEKFKNIIWASNLSDEDKNMWYELINRMDRISLIPLLESLELFPQDLSFLTKNFKDKVGAFHNQDEEAVEHILEEEKRFLEEE